MNDIQFVRIKCEDIPELRVAAATIWPECYAAILSREQIEYMLNRMYSPEKIKHEIEHEKIHYFFICHDGAKIGFLSLGPYPEIAGRAKLHKLYLYPEFHGKGLGTASLRKVFELASEQGYSSICLNVNKNNHPAIKAYERNGFVKLEAVVNDIGGGYLMDDYVMLAVIQY
ncbi:MAG: GNAT family N-acetyltransferase [Victivallaceae bacterium]|nr:GNAT family N-acetyltransferase [Victivallaceae bacterium]